MTGSSFDKIKKFYNQCRPEEVLLPDDPRYVDLSARGLRGNEEPRRMLSRAILLSDDGKWTYQLLTGFSGSGKSTELQLLAHELRKNSDFVVVYQDAEEIIDITQPLKITDILVTIGSMADDALRQVLDESQIAAAVKEGYWDRFVRFITQTKVDIGAVELKVGDKGLSTTIKATLRSSSSFRTKVQEELNGRLQQFAKECVDYLHEVNAILASAAHKKGMIFIIDSMEKIAGHSLNTEEVARSVQSTFHTNAQFLTKIPCHMIYTIPPYLHIMEPSLSQAYGNSTQILPMCRVVQKDSREPVPATIKVLQELLEKRVSLQDLFGNDWYALSSKLILASGGHPRDLLLLVRHALQLTEDLPVSPQILDQAIRKLFDAYQGSIYETDLKWLARIAISHGHDLSDEKQLTRLSALFRSHVVMCYYNGSPWYDLHPAVYKMERIQKTIQIEKAPANASVALPVPPSTQGQ